MFTEDWQHIFQSKVITADEAFGRYLKSGCRIFVGSGCSTPKHLVHTLASHLRQYVDVEVVYFMALGPSPLIQDSLRQACRVKTFFVTDTLREAVFEGRADYIPVYLARAPNLFRNGVLALDLTVIQVSPPDEHGFCSLGVSVDVAKAALDSADDDTASCC